MATQKTKEDWQAEIKALFHYLEFERKLTYKEAIALIRLLDQEVEQSISRN